ncbi:MAG: hypothetical protein IT208_15750 [Chthonomonadales bacterium]|nr:hypothetical protein [Chthonomonadales bacterium]
MTRRHSPLLLAVSGLLLLACARVPAHAQAVGGFTSANVYASGVASLNGLVTQVYCYANKAFTVTSGSLFLGNSQVHISGSVTSVTPLSYTDAVMDGRAFLYTSTGVVSGQIGIALSKKTVGGTLSWVFFGDDGETVWGTGTVPVVGTFNLFIR